MSISLDTLNRLPTVFQKKMFFVEFIDCEFNHGNHYECIDCFTSINQDLFNKINTMLSQKALNVFADILEIYEANIVKYGSKHSANNCRCVCAREVQEKIFYSKRLGLNTERKKWRLHQIAWSHKHGQQHTKGFFISHICGRGNCLNTEHMEYVPAKINLARCHCHKALKKEVLSRKRRKEHIEDTYINELRCSQFHEGPLCFWNYSIVKINIERAQTA